MFKNALHVKYTVVINFNLKTSHAKYSKRNFKNGHLNARNGFHVEVTSKVYPSNIKIIRIKNFLLYRSTLISV